MEFQKQSFKQDNFRIIFKEADWYAVDCLKNGERYNLALDITVMKTDEKGKEKEYGYYFRSFDKTPNIGHVSKFIDKFLADTAYRHQFFENGEEWNGEIKPDEGSLINARCVKAIKAMNSRRENKLAFRDFVSLKTYGVDGFSRMKKDALEKVVSTDDLKLVCESIKDDSMQLSALRWIARGLRPSLAIHKVKVDAEVANNAKQSWHY